MNSLPTDKIVRKLRDLPIFADLPSDMLFRLAELVEWHEVKLNQHLFEQGDPSDVLYVQRMGWTKLVTTDAEGQEIILEQHGPGQVVGDLTLFEDERRTGTLVGMTNARFWKLSRAAALEVLGLGEGANEDALRTMAEEMHSRLVLENLRNIEWFSNLPEAALVELADRLETRAYEKGDIVFNKGEYGETLYIIKAGFVSIFTETERGGKLVVNQCGPSDIVGEMSLVDDEPHSASVQAISPVEAYLLSRSQFLDVIRRHPSVALDTMRGISKKLRFATTYIEKTIEWSQRIAEGDYSFTLGQIEQTQRTIVDTQQSDEARASAMLSAFFSMVREVQDREEKLRKQVQSLKLKIEIDEAKRKEQVRELTQSTFFTSLKSTVKEIRRQRTEQQSEMGAGVETKTETETEAEKEKEIETETETEEES